mgnify:CR=1 FL=1
MNIKTHFETAWKLCVDNLLPLVILTRVLSAVSVISLGILAPVCFAGYTHSLNQLHQFNREPQARDIFSQFRLFIPLLIFGVAVCVIAAIGFLLLVLPGLIFTLIVTYTCLYMIPVMVDMEYGLVDAVKKSVGMVTGQNILDHVIVCLIFSVLTAIGGSSFIGFLFLQPFVTLFLLSAYHESK